MNTSRYNADIYHNYTVFHSLSADPRATATITFNEGAQLTNSRSVAIQISERGKLGLMDTPEVKVGA
jgi:hypothetical protein